MHQLSLAFDLFLARTRLESLMSLALQEAGISSGDYAVLSLVSIEPRDRGQDPMLLRAEVQLFSAAVRSMLPEP